MASLKSNQITQENPCNLNTRQPELKGIAVLVIFKNTSQNKFIKNIAQVRIHQNNFPYKNMSQQECESSKTKQKLKKC